MTFKKTITYMERLAISALSMPKRLTFWIMPIRLWQFVGTHQRPHHSCGYIPKFGEPQFFTTFQGSYLCQKYLMVTKISFPEFCKIRYILDITVCIFHSQSSRYGIIVGCDSIEKMEFFLD